MAIDMMGQGMMGEMPPQGDPMLAAMQDPYAVPPEPEAPLPAFLDASRLPDPFDESTTAETRELGRTRLMALFDQYRAYREQYVEPVWEEAYRSYHGVPPENNSPYGSCYPLKETFRQLETLKPQLAAQLLPEGKLFTYRPWSANNPDEEDRTLAATGIVHYHIRKFRLKPELFKWLEGSTMWGVSYLMYGWQKFRHTRRKIGKVVTREGKTAWERKTEEISEEGPMLRWLDHWSVYTDWREESLRDSPAVFVLDRVTAEYLKTLVKEGVLDALTVKKALEEPGGRATEANDKVESLRSRDESSQDAPNEEGEYELVTAYTNDNWVYSIIGGKHVARCQYNHLNRVPILTLRNYPQAGQHYGLGEPQIIMWDQALLNDTTSMLVDGAHYTLNPMMKVHRNAQKDWKSVAYKPGAAVFLDDLGMVEPMPVQPVVTQLMELANFQRRNMQLTTGQTDELQGVTRHRTAGGIKLLQDAAGMRVNYKISMFAPAFEELYTTLYDLEARFLSDEVAVRIEGADGKEFAGRYGPEAFETADIDVEVELPPEATTPETRQQKAIALYQLVAQDPRFKFEPLAAELLRSFDIKHPGRVMSNSLSETQSIQADIEGHMATGIMREAMPSDRHDIAIPALQMYTASPTFQGLPPEWQETAIRRLTQHQQAQAMITGQMQENAQTGQGEMNNTQAPGSDAMTEATFANGNMGAMQQGVQRGPMG